MEEAKKQTKDERREAARNGIPKDFPDELRPHARLVFAALRDLARTHASKEPSAAALARVMMGRPRRPLIKAAYDYAAYCADRPPKDVVAGYRNWLDKESDLAAVEPLPGATGGGTLRRMAAPQRAVWQPPASAEAVEHTADLQDRIRARFAAIKAENERIIMGRET